MKRLLRCLGWWLVGIVIVASASLGFTVYNLGAVALRIG